MTQKTRKQLSALAVAALGACLVSGGVVLAQTKQLKAPASAPKVVSESQSEGDSQNTVNLNGADGSSSYSVVIENHTTPDGKVVQSKKVWSNGNLVQEEEKELSADEANQGLNATIQLPNGQVAPGGVFQSEDDEDLFGGMGSPFEAIRRMEEQMRAQQEQMRAQFEALRNRIANGQADPTDSDDDVLSNLPNQANAAPSKYWIGMTIGTLPEILVSQLPIEENEGVLVQYVVPDSPAGKIGLKRYDVVHSINGQVVSNPMEVTTMVNKIGAEKVQIEYYRKGKLETAEIEIAERPQTLGLQSNLGIPLQNKKFQVVRPGVIVPSDELDASSEPAAEETSEETPEVEVPENDVQILQEEAQPEEKAE